MHKVFSTPGVSKRLNEGWMKIPVIGARVCSPGGLAISLEHGGSYFSGNLGRVYPYIGGCPPINLSSVVW